MKDYSLYYSYKKRGDILIVTFNSEMKETRKENKGRVTILYNNDEIIAYHIHDLKEIIKIKGEGMIYLPNKEMIMVINSILANEGLEPLEEKEHSGYFVKEVNGQKVVVAIPGTTLNDGTVTKDEHICTYKDLGISDEEEILLLDKDAEVGKDFFTMEVK